MNYCPSAPVPAAVQMSVRPSPFLGFVAVATNPATGASEEAWAGEEIEARMRAMALLCTPIEADHAA